MTREEALLSRHIHTGSRTAHAGNKPLRIFVPIDFSQCSYNALAYALQLAKVCQGAIDLYHITDLGDLPTSDNTVVMHRILGQLEEKMNAQIQSLKEMINEHGVMVTSSDQVIAHTSGALAKRLRELNPDLMVVGQQENSYQNLSALYRQLDCPMLVVPDHAAPALPDYIVLASDKKPVTEKALSPLFKIMQATTRTLSVLTVKGQRSRRRMKGFELPLHGYHFQIDYQEQLDRNVARGIQSFVSAHSVNLICIIDRKQFSWRRLFRKSIAAQLSNHVTAPLLILKESRAAK